MMTTATPPRPDFEAAQFLRPCAGEFLSGDAALVAETDHGLLLAIVDGLGHGPERTPSRRGPWTSWPSRRGPT